MTLLYKFACTSFFLVAVTGCSDKQFSLQSYADKYFNNTKNTESNISAHDSSKNNKVTNSSIKTGPASKIVWSRNYKNDNKPKGAMQTGLDTWLEEEWEPSFEGNETQAKKDENSSRNFTLQHYYNKSQIYLQKQEEKKKRTGERKEPAHYEKMNQLPVIGK